ncbi:hypothetical protein CEY04_12745 [Achromobacter sp. HZ28]|nr:hypothetical protein CEY04_12745 [Achromobacter sp. HZ28]OWT77757.1 hypothetical protein CEY05_07240 [Achromobacter sp. HZ34]
MLGDFAPADDIALAARFVQCLAQRIAGHRHIVRRIKTVQRTFDFLRTIEGQQRFVRPQAQAPAAAQLDMHAQVAVGFPAGYAD